MTTQKLMDLINNEKSPNWLVIGEGSEANNWVSEHQISLENIHTEAAAGLKNGNEIPMYFRLAKPPYVKGQIYCDGMYFPFYGAFAIGSVEELPSLDNFFDGLKELYKKYFLKSMYGDSAAAYTLAYVSVDDESQTIKLRLANQDESVNLHYDEKIAFMLNVIKSALSETEN